MRWSDFQQRNLWVNVEFIMWRDEHRDVSRAVNKLLQQGWFSTSVTTPMTIDPETGYSKPDPKRKPTHKRWGPFSPPLKTRDAFTSRIIDGSSPAGAQTQPDETLRKEFSKILRRYRSDREFREDCDSELERRKKAHPQKD